MRGIEPGTLCTVGYEPESAELCGLMVEARKYLGAMSGTCKCNNSRRWEVAPYPPGMYPCECILFPVPPDSLEKMGEKDKETTV